MENQQKGSGKKSLAIKVLLFGIIAIACGIIWFMYTDGSNSRESTPAEIAAQEEFEKKLITSQEEFQQETDVARKEAEQTGTHPKWSEAKTDSLR